MKSNATTIYDNMNTTHTPENISLTTQGIRGGETKSQKAGFVLIELRQDQDRITVDDFEGRGETYKQREMLKIEIIQNGDVLFSGSKYELFEILKHSAIDKATQP